MELSTNEDTWPGLADHLQDLELEASFRSSSGHGAGQQLRPIFAMQAWLPRGKWELQELRVYDTTRHVEIHV